MPSTEREIALRRIAVSVAARFLAASVTRVAAWNMDMLARLSILEGAAGVAPGTWLRRRERGFGVALDHFGPKLAAAWTTSRNQGVYDGALAAAARGLRGATGMDATDLVQEMVAGSTSPGGTARSRVFYAVGDKLRKFEHDLGAGVLLPSDGRIKGSVDRWVARAARDIVELRREKKRVRHSPGVTAPHGPTRLDDQKRDSLLMLALQSPGGPGNELRRIIDAEIDRAFRPAQRPIVRAFLNKIGQPKYRSPEQMKRLVSKFSADKWFTQAYNLVRREIMEELGVSPQVVSNALGGGARNVFKFMSDRVGKNPRVKRLMQEIADEIELLEPGVARVAKDEGKLRHSVVRRWLEQKEREANLSSDSALAGLDEHFEKDEYKEWDEQVSPHIEHHRGPSPLRVAALWIEGRA